MFPMFMLFHVAFSLFTLLHNNPFYEYSTMYLSINATVYGHLVYFQFGAVMNCADINTTAYVSRENCNLHPFRKLEITYRFSCVFLSSVHPTEEDCDVLS